MNSEKFLLHSPCDTIHSPITATITSMLCRASSYKRKHSVRSNKIVIRQGHATCSLSLSRQSCLFKKKNGVPTVKTSDTNGRSIFRIESRAKSSQKQMRTKALSVACLNAWEWQRNWQPHRFANGMWNMNYNWTNCMNSILRSVEKCVREKRNAFRIDEGERRMRHAIRQSINLFLSACVICGRESTSFLVWQMHTIAWIRPFANQFRQIFFSLKDFVSTVLFRDILSTHRFLPLLSIIDLNHWIR